MLLPKPRAFASNALPGIAVFGLALLVRLLCVAELRSTPFFANLIVDSAGYDRWALRIAGGDWLGSRPFYQAPLYPYFLGIIYTLFGRDLMLVRVVQSLVGAAGCVMLMQAGTLWINRRAGIAAGIMMALYAPAVFFDSVIQKSVLDLALFSTVLAVLGRTTSSSTADPARVQSKWALVSGMSIGLLTLTRENALVLIPFAALWCWLLARRGRARPWVVAGALIIGAMLILGPVYVRNVTFGARTAITTYQFGTNFYIGNHQGAEGDYDPLIQDRGSTEFEEVDARALAEKESGRSLAPDEISRFWTLKALREISARPGEWGRLLLRKVGLSLNRIEIIDTDDIYYHEQYSIVLRVLNSIWNFGLLLPLAMLGIALSWKQFSSRWILHLFIVLLFASMVAFYVVARYRLAATPVLMLFAAEGAIGGWKLLREHRSRELLPGLVAAALGFVLAFLPLVSKSTQLATAHFNAAGIHMQNGSLSQAITDYERSIELGRNTTATWMNYGNTLYKAGRMNEARKAYERALPLTEDPARVLLNLGNTYLQQARFSDAVNVYRRAGGIQTSSELENALGLALAKSGSTNEAEQHLRKSVQMNAKYAPAYRNLANLLQEEGRTTEAEELARVARDLLK